MTLLTGEDFTRLFTGFDRAAFRLETRTSYGVVEEDEAYRRFLAGKDPGIEWLRPWLGLMKSVTGEGKRVERVRVVDTPPSDYMRFELSVTPHNLAAGEDIRFLSRTRARALALPEYDFWVFDSRRVAFLWFGERDEFLGAEVVHDPAVAAQHRRWRDIAWQHAIPYDEYVT